MFLVALKPSASIEEITSEIVKRLNENSRRVKKLEQKIGMMEDQMEAIQDAALNQMDDLRLSLERIVQNISSLAEKLRGIDDEILRINKKLNKAATKDEIKEVKTFIDIINPLTSTFVTKDELKRRLKK